MEDSVLEMVKHMSEHEDGKAFNIHEYYQEFTYDVISRLAMGQPNSEQFNNGGVEHVKKVQLSISVIFQKVAFRSFCGATEFSRGTWLCCFQV